MRIAGAKDGSLLAKRMRKVDSHLAVVAGAVILAHEDVEQRMQTFVEVLGKGECALILQHCVVRLSFRSALQVHRYD